MKHLFIGVVSLLIPLFLVWVAVYYSQGYNLIDNVAHLDLASMLSNFNSSLKDFNTFSKVKNVLFDNADKIWDYIGKVAYGQATYSDNRWSIVVNVLNATYKIINAILKPITKFANFFNYNLDYNIQQPILKIKVLTKKQHQ